MKLRMTEVSANIRAVRYTANDHFHGRLPVKTSHSKPSVVTNSHLRQATVSIAESVGYQDRRIHVDAVEYVDDFDKAH